MKKMARGICAAVLRHHLEPPSFYKTDNVHFWLSPKAHNDTSVQGVKLKEGWTWIGV